jgi:hypothetical protein
VAAVTAGIISGSEARQYLGIVPWSGPDPAWEDRSPAVKEPEPVPAALAASAETQTATNEEETA